VSNETVQQTVCDYAITVDRSSQWPSLKCCKEAPKYSKSLAQPVLVLATGRGNLPAVRVRTAKMFRFGSNPIQKPDLLHRGGPNPDPYPSTRGFCRVWLDPLVPISGSSIRVILFMVAFRYPIANRKILTLVDRCPFLMYWPPLKSKTSDNCSLPHPENDSQRQVNDCWSCTFGNLSGNWMQTFINEV